MPGVISSVAAVESDLGSGTSGRELLEEEDGPESEAGAAETVFGATADGGASHASDQQQNNNTVARCKTHLRCRAQGRGLLTAT